MLVLVVGQIIIAVYAFLYVEDLGKAAQRGFDKLWNDMATNNNEMSRQAIYGIQQGLQCCGSSAADNWNLHGGIPASCCAGGTECLAGNAFKIGCRQQLFDVVSVSGLLIAWVSIVFAAIELVGVIFACCLAQNLRNLDRRQYA